MTKSIQLASYLIKKLEIDQQEIEFVQIQSKRDQKQQKFLNLIKKYQNCLNLIEKTLKTTQN